MGHKNADHIDSRVLKAYSIRPICVFRYHPKMRSSPTLRRAANGCRLVLDTTYCSPEHSFPPQDEVLRSVRESVAAAAFNPRTLFLFGTYTIGKERVFAEARGWAHM